MRSIPEDFQVKEIPAYEPSGEGEHLFLEITKKQITTQAVISELAHALGIPSNDIGYAGMKDRQAVTTQRISVPAATWPKESIDFSFQVKILGLHNNKIRTGHLKGNHFQIRLRQVSTDWPQLVPPIVEELQQKGFANFYGPQRFGRDGDNAEVGLKALRSGRVFGPKWRKWLIISALQSELFNNWLNRRINDGLFSVALKGDVFGKLPQGGIFYSQNPEDEQPRLDNFEISPLGPIFGYKMFKAKDEALEREKTILDEYSIDLEQFRALKAEGSRRKARLKVENLQVSEADGDPVFSFTLPAGSYASVFMGEFMKNDLTISEAQEDDNEG